MAHVRHGGRLAALVSAMLMAGLFAIATRAEAGGPRFVTGTTFWATQSGNPIAFRINNPLYYTDPGALSSTVTHAQADAMVAAAAAPWNIPAASLTLSQGGALSEHVSSGNVSVSRKGVAFPADVAASNYVAKPIAVIYDTDGSVTDLLLGSGASDPLGCRQTGVTETVDQFGPAGTIDHAIILVNGRCATGSGDPLLQLQYQVERAFGRILGLAWSQVNDNVFTGATPPTAQQVSYWPVMHPVDVICGLYTYQCMTSPFSLRPDDRNALEQLYPVLPSNLSTGKVLSTSNSAGIKASLQFPTGQGMDMVNVTVRRMPIGRSEVELYQAVSGVSGVQYQQVFANAIRGAVSDANNVGTAWEPAEALLSMPYVEVGDGATLFMTTEAINPLYTDDYAIGPYSRPPVTPSGSVQAFTNYSAKPGTGQGYTITVNDAASNCQAGGDGTEWEPAAGDPSGWWNGQLCLVGHTAWLNAAVKGGRSWTLEVDALDEGGALTLQKMQPLLGVWKSEDPRGTLPTVAMTPVAMNTMAAGVTQIRMPVTAADASFRVAVADQFGGGRPDFLYRTRILAADGVTPSIVAMGGGQITVSGRGFQPGMQVLVNGVAGTVVSSTATTIVARVPTMAASRGTSNTPLQVMVLDTATGGSSTIIDALRYSAVALNMLRAVSSPTALKTGLTADTSFAVKVLAGDGLTPVAGASVRLSVTSGSAMLGACGTAASCTLTSDAGGVVRTSVTGIAAGPVALSATELSSGATVTANMIDVDPIRTATIADPPRYLAAGGSGSWALTISAIQDGATIAGVPVIWTVSAGGMLNTTSTSTGTAGTATAAVSVAAPAAGSTITVTGCVWGTICASWQVKAVDPAQWTIAVSSGAGQSGSVTSPLTDVVFAVTDPAGHAVEGAAITLYQTVEGWEGPCEGQGRCASAPVLAATQTALSTDGRGLLSVRPMTLPGIPQVVNLAAVAGLSGFVTLSLPITP